MLLAWVLAPFCFCLGAGLSGVPGPGLVSPAVFSCHPVSLVACIWSPEIWATSHQVKARGPGLEKTGVAVNKPAEFTVDAKHGGKAPLRVQVQVGYPPVVQSWGGQVSRSGH